MSFLKNLATEILTNGKLVTGYIITQIPNITSFPGLGSAVKTAITDHTIPSYIDLAAQILMAIGAAIKAKKIVIAATNKTI